MHDYRKADLSPRERALCDFAVKLTREAASIRETDIDALRAEGVAELGHLFLVIPVKSRKTAEVMRSNRERMSLTCSAF